MNARALAFGFLGVLTALRLVLIGQFELFPDEAYYFMWSERMDWSFFSKGPGVAAAMWISTHLFPASEWGIRFFSPLLSLGTSLILWALARRLFSESVALWTVLMINVTPIFQAGSLVMTIDPLSIFFWAGALATLWRALEKSPAFSLWWPASGLLIGLGFLAKYTNAMQIVSLVLLLAITQKYRSELRRPGLYALLAVFLACCIPVIVWNARNDWVTLGHLTARGGLEQPFALRPGEFARFLGMHFGVYSPLIFAGMIVAAAWAWGRSRHSFKLRFLLAFTLPLVAMYFWLSLKQAGEANWTAPAMLSLAVLTAALWHEKAMTSVGCRRFAVAALLLGGFLSCLVVNPDIVRASGIEWSHDKDPGKRMRGWTSLARAVEAVRAEVERELGEPVFLIANEHELASGLSYYLEEKRIEGDGHPPVYIPAQPYFVNQYSFWPRYDQLVDLPPGYVREDGLFTEEQGFNPFKGRSALYLTDRAEDRPPSAMERAFGEIRPYTALWQERHGMPLRQVRIFLCIRFLDPGVP
jgi:hypothetical protein